MHCFDQEFLWWKGWLTCPAFFICDIFICSFSQKSSNYLAHTKWDCKYERWPENENLISTHLFWTAFRSSHQRCSLKIGILRNFAKSTWKHLCQSHFCLIVAGLGPVTLLKTRFWQSCFPVNFARFLRTSFLQNTSGDYFWTLGIFTRFIF